MVENSHKKRIEICELTYLQKVFYSFQAEIICFKNYNKVFAF